MSHYSCAVFANDPWDFDALLAPYSESDESYYCYTPLSDEAIARQRKYYEEYREHYPNAPIFDEWMRNEGFRMMNNEWCHYGNPNGMWDWYTIDGKDWIFEFKKGHGYDSEGHYKKSDINFQHTDPEARQEAAEFWENHVLGDGDTGIYKPEYFLKRYKTKQQYVKECSKIVPYCFVKPDGEWVSPGRVGWFATDDSTAESWNEYEAKWKDFILNAPDCYMTVADMHI